MLKLCVLTLHQLWELNSREYYNSSSSLPSHLLLLSMTIHCGAAESCQYIASCAAARHADAMLLPLPGLTNPQPPVADSPQMRAGPRLATRRKRRRCRRTLEDCSSSDGPKALRIHAESDTERLSERAGRGVFVCARVRTKGARVSSCMCVLAVGVMQRARVCE